MKSMFKNKFILIALVLGFLFVGCGYKTTNTQIRDIGYLKFNKNPNQNFKIIVNEKYTFMLNSCVFNKDTGNCYDDTSNKMYEIESGNINLKVYDSNGTLIMDKEFFVGSNNTIEVNL